MIMSIVVVMGQGDPRPGQLVYVQDTLSPEYSTMHVRGSDFGLQNTCMRV